VGTPVLRDLDGPLKGIFGEETIRRTALRIIAQLRNDHPELFSNSSNTTPRKRRSR
jgi:hypothetical protein